MWQSITQRRLCFADKLTNSFRCICCAALLACVAPQPTVAQIKGSDRNAESPIVYFSCSEGGTGHRTFFKVDFNSLSVNNVPVAQIDRDDLKLTWVEIRSPHKSASTDYKVRHSINRYTGVYEQSIESGAAAIIPSRRQTVCGQVSPQRKF